MPGCSPAGQVFQVLIFPKSVLYLLMYLDRDCAADL